MESETWSHLHRFLADNGRNAGVRIQQIDSRVALVVQHLVKRKRIIVDAVMAQICIFDAAVCYGLVQARAFIIAQSHRLLMMGRVYVNQNILYVNEGILYVSLDIITVLAGIATDALLWRE